LSEGRGCGGEQRCDHGAAYRGKARWHGALSFHASIKCAGYFFIVAGT
jgi:hypothetical protein